MYRTTIYQNLAMSQLWQNPTEFPSQVTLLRKDF